MIDQPTPQPPDRISVVEPLSRAIDWARDVLFRPFQLEKWIVLGFCAWLATLGEGGGGGPGGSTRWQPSGGCREFERGLHQAWDWFLDHLLPILLIVGFLVVVCFVIWLLVVWLSSRGKFMFLDGVVLDRAAVVAPWHQFRELANSLFGFRVVLGLVGLAVVVVILACTAWLVWLWLADRGREPLLFVGLFFGVTAIVAVALVFGLVRLAINDFVVPLMYLRNCRVVEAWRELGQMVSARPGAFLLYVLIKIVLAVVVFAIALVACCLTCCIVLLPFVGKVILLPVWVLLRAYPLYFLGQFGPQYSRFATLGGEAEVSPAPTE